MLKFLKILVSTVFPLLSVAQGSWEQKTDYPDNVYATFGFSIGDLGYIGMGWNPSQTFEMHSYDPTTDEWTPKSDFPGSFLGHPVSFSANGKGYVCTGLTDGNFVTKQLWEYDPAIDTWEQKSDLPGDPRTEASGFVINDILYIGAGSNSVIRLNDFWSYDPTTDIGDQIADFPGTGRSDAISFSIEGKGYFGLGAQQGGVASDFWEYDPATNTWTQLADFAPGPRWKAIAFSINGMGYVGTGRTLDNVNTNDFWKYDPTDNSWTQVADLGDQVRAFAEAFSINNKGYVGTGGDDSAPWFNDFWEYTADEIIATKTIEDLVIKNISPNPCSKQVRVAFSRKIELDKFIILNSFGQTMTSSIHLSTDSIEIETEHFPEGIYFLCAKKDNELIYLGKFIKNE